MSVREKSFINQKFDDAVTSCREGYYLLRLRGPGQIQFWFIALLVGIAAGFAALFFRKGVNALQEFMYGTEDVRLLHSFAESLPWYLVLIIPIFGGLVVGIILSTFTKDARARSVADVIYGAAMRNGRVETKAGLASALASMITLGTGGSTGREGPVVHLAAVISTWVNRWILADGITGRDLLGCAVAAAVSASFNAPIAGALFALEVVLRHFAVHAFAPIVIASAAGTVINRLEFGGVVEFSLGTVNEVQFYQELPAYMMLGLLSGLVAVVLMRAIFLADDVGSVIQKRLSIPRWLRPAFAGAMLGALAIYYPHIIGVGYETTFNALAGQLLLWDAVVFAVLKTAAVAITMAGRMGGGVFSPSLMIGALTGLSFGLVATGLFPDVSGSISIYALAGMGAVAAAVLGAPISTTLIVFELTGDWQTGLAVMIAVSLSTALASQLVHRSFFLTQLERRDIHLAAGPQAYLLSMFRVSAVTRGREDLQAADEARCRELMAKGIYTRPNATLEAAMPLFDHGHGFVPVVTPAVGDGPPRLVGAVYHVDALKIYNRALAAAAAEEHS